MKDRSWRIAKCLVLVSVALLSVLVMVTLWKSVLVLEIACLGVEEPVSPGEVFVRTYTNSMYEAPVHEVFRIEDGHLRLVHVKTESDAVLAYLGIESKDEPNVNLKLTEFNIPAASTGRHMIRLHNRYVSLGTREGRDGTIRVKLIRVPLILHFGRLIWR